jgi:hypothetical protein
MMKVRNRYMCRPWQDSMTLAVFCSKSIISILNHNTFLASPFVFQQQKLKWYGVKRVCPVARTGETLVRRFISSMAWSTTAFGGLVLINRRGYTNSRINLNFRVVEITTCWLNSRFIREKNVWEVFPFLLRDYSL